MKSLVDHDLPLPNVNRGAYLFPYPAVNHE